jgi:predicted transcriptional regulator
MVERTYLHMPSPLFPFSGEAQISLAGFLAWTSSARLPVCSPAACQNSPVVDRNIRVLGVIDPPAIIRWRRQGHPRTVTLAQLFEGTSPTIAYPEEYLATVVEKMNSANVAHLPVVSRAGGRLVGYLGWKDILGPQAY